VTRKENIIKVMVITNEFLKQKSEAFMLKKYMYTKKLLQQITNKLLKLKIRISYSGICKEKIITNEKSPSSLSCDGIGATLRK
jgi:hypothetical protein